MWWVPLAGAAVAGAASAFGQSQANRSNLRIAREQMAFQERMSNTSYQRAMQDMRAAGLNPMLAYQQGGASSPPGASAKMESAIGPGVSSAMSALRLSQELKIMEAQRQNINADTWKKTREANLTDAQWRVLSFGPEGEVPYAVLKMKEEYLNAQREGRYKEAQTLRTAIEAESIRLGLPAQAVLGSKGAAWTRLLFGGSGVVGGSARAVSSALGGAAAWKFIQSPAKVGRRVSQWRRKY